MALFEIQADTNLEAVLRDVRGRGQSVDRLLPTVAEMLVGGVLDVIEAEGPGWTPLADSTLRARRKAGRGAKILQDTGVAAATIGQGFGADYAEAFAGVDYLVYHASAAPRTVIPRRNPFDLGPFEGPLLNEVAELLLEQVP
jgi:hypothetical protein